MVKGQSFQETSSISRPTRSPTEVLCKEQIYLQGQIQFIRSPTTTLISSSSAGHTRHRRDKSWSRDKVSRRRHRSPGRRCHQQKSYSRNRSTSRGRSITRGSSRTCTIDQGILMNTEVGVESAQDLQLLLGGIQNSLRMLLWNIPHCHSLMATRQNKSSPSRRVGYDSASEGRWEDQVTVSSQEED